MPTRSSSARKSLLGLQRETKRLLMGMPVEARLVKARLIDLNPIVVRALASFLPADLDSGDLDVCPSDDFIVICGVDA